MKANNRKILSAELTLALLIVAIMIFLAIAAPGFYSIQNIMQVMRVFSYTFIAGIGMTMIFITGNTDISFGAVVSVIAIVCAALSSIGVSFAVFLLVGILVGAILCGLNCFIITKFKIPAMVVTLATTQIYFGALLLVVDGSIYNLPQSWTWFAEVKLFSVVPLYVVIALVLLVTFMVVARYSRFFKKLYAIGNNAQAARNVGINVEKTLMITYIIAGALLAFSALILGTNGNRVTCTVGANLEMHAIAAVIVGGSTSMGGDGKIYGTALGSLLLALVSPALVFLGINTYWTNLFMGVIIVTAIIAGVLRQIRFTKRKEESKEGA